MESERVTVAAKEAAARRALGRQVLEDAERLVLAWNARQQAHMPMLFSPTIGAATTALLVPVGALPSLSDHDVD
jgi:hypothetical protein